MKSTLLLVLICLCSIQSFSQADLLKENFDNQFPPAKWSVSSTSKKWLANPLDRHPFSIIDKQNINSAVCPWEENLRTSILVSPRIIATTYQSIFLSFYAGFNKTMLSTDTLDLIIKTDSLASWSDNDKTKTIWTATVPSSDTVKASWSWRRFELDLFDYKEKNFNLAWRSHGKYGDVVAIDSIHMTAGGLSKRAEITSLSLPNQTKAAAFSKTGDTITVTIANEPGLKTLSPIITTSLGAKIIEPANSTSLDYTVTPVTLYNIVVQANDPSVTKKWILKILVDNYSHETQITGFSIAGQIGNTIIDTTYSTATITVKGGTILKDINPTIKLSLGATSEPAITDKFTFIPNKPVSITVKPQDANYTSQKWSLIVKVVYDNDILSFALPGSNSSPLIDTVRHMVTLEVDNSVNLVQTIPSIDISPGCYLFPAKTQAVTFTPDLPFTYRLSGDSVNFVDWSIVIMKKEKFIYEEGFDQSTLPAKWRTTAMKGESGWLYKDQPRIPFSSIYYNSKSSALHPWSYSYQNDSIITEAYDFTKYSNITVKFYAGFNKAWLDSADLKFFILKAPNYTPVLKWDAKTDTSTSRIWKWNLVKLSVPELDRSTAKLAWQYVGAAGDLVGLDRLMILGDNSKSTNIDNDMPIKSDISIYPNPATNFFWIDQANFSTLKIFRLSGALVAVQRITTDHQEIDITGIDAGIYIIEVEQNTTKKIFKLIISK